MANQRYIDLIYEGRNKKYGAYLNQHRSPMYALLGFLLSCLLLIGTLGSQVWWKTEDKKNANNIIRMQHKKVVAYSQLSAPPPIETVKKQPPLQSKIQVAQPRAVRKFLKPVVKKDEEVQEEDLIPTVKELKKVNIGKKNVEGDTTGAISNFDMTDVDVNLDISPYPTQEVEVVEDTPAPPPKEAPKEEEVYQFVEIKPAFPGGLEGLMRFLAENLNYPMEARESHIMGTVVAEFVVEKDGRITNINIIRDIGGGCAGETLRVLEMMPRWSPGIQNDKTVRAKMILPVRFKLEE